MAHDADGRWIGYGVGDVDDPSLPLDAPNYRAIELMSAKLYQKYQWARSTGFSPGPSYTPSLAAVVREFCERTGLPVVLDADGNAVATLAMRTRLGSYPPPPPPPAPRGIFLTIEGHCSDMMLGPVADTATQLEAEGLCWHQPTGYENCSIPFRTQTGVDEAARLLSLTELPGPPGQPPRPFPPGTPWMLGAFSEGGIAAFELYVQQLSPGMPLDWREEDRIGALVYGPPCREEGSIAPWAASWIKSRTAHGLDPYRRFGRPGFPKTPPNWMDVLREGDIFAEVEDTPAGTWEEAVYQAVARGDFWSDPYSIAHQIASVFSVGIGQVFGMVMAMVNGVVFLADQPNPHYSPYDLTGGRDWARERFRAALNR